MKKRAATLALFALLGALLAAAPAEAAPAPAWQLSINPLPANFAPGEESEYQLLATNTGATTTSGPLSLSLDLPEGIAPLTFSASSTQPGTDAPECTIGPSQLDCQTSEPLDPGRQLEFTLQVAVSATAEGSLAATAAIAGGGAPQGAIATAVTPISPDPVPFGPLQGFQAPALTEAGTVAFTAGSHPYQLTVDFNFPTERRAKTRPATGHPRDIAVDLPPGLIGNPAASQQLCTEAFLEAHEECPSASQVGIISLITESLSSVTPIQSPLYAMVPPPGAPAEFAFDAAGVGIFVHLVAGLRSDSDYGITTTTPDVLAYDIHPVVGARVQLWGDPSSSAHDHTRGLLCLVQGTSCAGPVPAQQIPFFTMPGLCPGQPPRFEIHADSWEQPGLFESAAYEAADAEGNPVAVAGCDVLAYEPTISVQPTTNLADSPSGLEVDLHQPQEAPHEEPLTGVATAELKNARVTLPPGLVTNPSQADGLAACSEEEIGYLGEGHYSKQLQSCPDGAKLGSVEVTSPLLVQRDEEHKLVTDPETGAPLPEPLHGTVYLAKPFNNQFGSLLAIYLAIESPRYGIVSKLAGKVEADPTTGQLTAVFENNPQLPLEDIRLSLFKGDRAPLISPPVCGSHTTTSTLTPWTTPEGADAHPESSFQTTAAPGGGACPASESAMPHSPAFSAGTLSPQAGAYSPFVLKLSREDGSQRLAGIDTTLPPGLIGKLAGIPECGDGQIAQAEARREPEEGKLERENPSCPATSEVGVVNVGAGAGPNPIYTQGRVYLAGPYKGAPVSLVAIVPAIAGPFDLGTVVTRVALHVEPETAQIHAISDPLPQILDGIPLDVRSVALRMDRPQFTLNPTSCEPMSITGSAASDLGQSAALSERFQVGGCKALGFKPKLSLRLKGSVKRSATPRLVANLTARPGDANIARAQVKLPPAVFLDQAHIVTICTRVQFAADACPAGSVYGKAEATTPLLDQPLSGAVYLRSNPSHVLPDLVAKLRGPAAQPVEIDLVGKTDAVKAALRNTFEAVPDAPVSHFRLELFGGKRGLVEMSGGFCAHRRASVKLAAHNGRKLEASPLVGAKCPKRRQHKKHRRK